VGKDPGQLKPKRMKTTARKPWLDQMLDTKAISPEAKAQRKHDLEVVAAMKEKMNR